MLTGRPAPAQPRQAIELLVVGALTIDRFRDGITAAGGSVLHATRAGARARASITVVTAAGPEREAQVALSELRRVAKVVVEEVPHTIVFEHDEEGGRRKLTLIGNVRLRPDVVQLQRLRPRAMLLAPVAGELDAVALGMVAEAVEARVRVAALQGWLRHRQADGRVTPVELGDLPSDVLAALRNCDAVVVSHEDLGRAEALPSAAAAGEIHRWLPGPAVFVTWGGAGHVRADPALREPAVVRRHDAIEGVPTVGAGDAFAAVIAIQLAKGASLAAAARAADAAVERWLARQPGARRKQVEP
jgi:sugar/nucleoside kinase (ribokinase family)